MLVVRPSQIIGGFQTSTGNVAVPLGVVTRLFPPDPDRYAIYFFSHLTVSYAVCDDPQVLVDSGIGVPAAGTGFMATFPDWGQVVTAQWFAVGVSGALNVKFKLIRYSPQG